MAELAARVNPPYTADEMTIDKAESASPQGLTKAQP
jgi:hypothetical protein